MDEIVYRGKKVSESTYAVLLGEAEPISRHFVLDQPCSGDPDCGVDHNRSMAAELERFAKARAEFGRTLRQVLRRRFPAIPWRP